MIKIISVIYNLVIKQISILIHSYIIILEHITQNHIKEEYTFIIHSFLFHYDED